MPDLTSTVERPREPAAGTPEEKVLEIVEAFVGELGGARAVGLDDSLERDLGLGSLERVELLLRLETDFGSRFPDDVFAEAASPRDLARAVRAGVTAEPERAGAPRAPLAAAVPAPGAARTLVEVLRWHAESNPDRPHVFLQPDGGDERVITYGHLWARATAIAAGLRDRGVRPGERIAVMLRTEEMFFAAFFGALVAGAVPVPIYPPFRADRLEEYAARQVRILRNAEARLLVTFTEAARIAGLLRARVPSLADVVVGERLAVAGVPPPHRALAGDSALIQYTSGSTGDPKGVLLSHANLLANIRAFGEALGLRADDVGVSWLPLYHDMGLIGSWLGALYFDIPIAIFSPLAFLSRPARWLRAIHRHRATLSPAPNFAFDLCVKKIRDDEIEGVDLTSWRLALNGSEPVSVETIERFARRFAAYGFRREAMCPVYGLAEASVALTTSPVLRGPRIDRVERETFQRSRVARASATEDTTALAFVSCGRALPGHEVQIVDGTGRPVDERVEGRIEFRGPSVTRGYFRNPAVTRAAIRDGWMDSGDLGYQADGELFITGRRKDVIIKAGRNLYPQEAEEVAGEVPGIRKGCVAAFGVADPNVGTERFVVVAESRQEAREDLRAAVRERVVAALGIPPDVVVIAPPGSVLKTSSGKIRRAATRDAYLRGAIGRSPASPRRQMVRLLARDVGARADRLARRLGALVFAAWAGAVVLLTLPALWSLVLLLRGRAVDRVARRWCRVVLTLTGCRPHVTGLGNLPVSGSAVLAANHASYLDTVALLAAIPADFRFVAKRELTAVPLVRTVIAKVGHLAVERADLSQSVADAERATAMLRRGVSLLFFPEGTFRAAAELLPFKLGAFKAAAEAGCPVVPITLDGTRAVLPAGTWLPRRGTIRVSVGTPITPASTEWREVVRLRDATRAAIAAHLTGTG